jgi:deoxyribodipyrimidine photolyase
MGNKRLSYIASFRLHVVQYAEKYGKKSAGHKFDVRKQCIREWCEKSYRMHWKVSGNFTVSKVPSLKLKVSSVLMSWT